MSIPALIWVKTPVPKARSAAITRYPMPPTRSDCPSLLAALTGSAVATVVDVADDPADDTEAFDPVDVGSGSSSMSLSPLRCADTTTRPDLHQRHQTGADHHPVGM